MRQDDPTSHADVTQHDHQTPRDAASLLILKGLSTNAPSVLMGRRHPGNAFLPNKYVFPGGRFDQADCHADASGSLSDVDNKYLSVSLSSDTDLIQARSLALTAIRETFEETGVIIGAAGKPTRQAPSASWQSFFDTGHLPNPSRLTFFARAITPPGRPRRYDTRFFYVDADDISVWQPPADNELSDVDWVALKDAQEKDLANITRTIFSDLQRLVFQRSPDTCERLVPFYFYDKTGLQRVLLSHQDGTA